MLIRSSGVAFDGVSSTAKSSRGISASRLTTLVLIKTPGLWARAPDLIFRFFFKGQVDFTPEEMSLLPSVISMGGDGATYDIGFGALSRVLSTSTPIKVVVLTGYPRQRARTEDGACQNQKSRNIFRGPRIPHVPKYQRCHAQRRPRCDCGLAFGALAPQRNLERFLVVGLGRRLRAPVEGGRRAQDVDDRAHEAQDRDFDQSDGQADRHHRDDEGPDLTAIASIIADEARRRHVRRVGGDVAIPTPHR